MERCPLGNTYCHPFAFRVRILLLQGEGQVHGPEALREILLVEHGDFDQMRLQGLDKPIREHGDAVLASLPVPSKRVRTARASSRANTTGSLTRFLACSKPSSQPSSFFNTYR